MAHSKPWVVTGSVMLCPSLFSSLQFEMPPTYQSYIYLVLNALLYGVIAWYLDAVIRG